MNKSYPLSEIQKLLDLAQNILVLIPGSPSFDQVASSLALYLALSKSKQVAILSPEEMIVEFSHLVGLDKVGSKVPGGELVLTINSPIENIEKVTSNDDGGKLNLIIRPKPGVSTLKKEDIVFSQAGSASDLLFIVEARKLESLGKIYQENAGLFREKPMVNINHYPKAEQFGQVNVIDPAASSCSEVMVALIQGLALPVDEDISTNLLLGLKNATQNFQSQATTAETFEAAAFCLKNGAGRPSVPPQAEEENLPPVAPQPDWFEPKIYKGSTLP